MTQHVVKSWVTLFDPIFSGRKTHDLRVMDRDYKVGDTLVLQEYDWATSTYTGRETKAEITYITSADTPCAFSTGALNSKFAILSIRKLDA